MTEYMTIVLYVNLVKFVIFLIRFSGAGWGFQGGW